jgi:hypothetical protein
MKNKLLILAMGLALTTQMIMAQVPSYVPTNGLVGYWPFSGNANDESGNGNNGVVNGPNLTNDRFGNIGKAYSFDGVNDYIEISNSLVNNSNTSFSIFGWFNCNYNNETIDIISDRTTNDYNVKYRLSVDSVNNGKLTFYCLDGPNLIELISNEAIVSNLWNNFTITFNQTNLEYKLYVNGILQQNLVSSSSLSNNNTNATQIGRLIGPDTAISPDYLFDGDIDDLGIWNRALSQQEITNLNNSANTNECLTMIINTGILSTNPFVYTSSVNIYPNPANDQITIDCGNLANVVGWNIKITNMLGQEVFSQPMNTQQYVVPLNSWTGQGMYFVKIINAQNEVVNIKKIVLQ